ncbi:MAG: ATP-binding protein [Streptosporangiaceae bacterium]
MPAPAKAGQPDSAGGQSGGGHRTSRRPGPFSRLLRRGQPAEAPAAAPMGPTPRTAAPTGARPAAPERQTTAPTRAEVTGPAPQTTAPTRAEVTGPAPQTAAPTGAEVTGPAPQTAAPTGARPAGPTPWTRPGAAPPADRSSPATAGPVMTEDPGDSGDSGSASRSEQPGISWAPARPAPGQLGIEAVDERLDPDQAAREHFAAFGPDEARGPGVPRDSGRAWRDTSPIPPFPGSARSRAGAPPPPAAWVAGRADGPGRPVDPTGPFPGRPVPPVPAGSLPSAPPFVMPAPTFASVPASPSGSSAVPERAAAGQGQAPSRPEDPDRDVNPLYRVLAGLALRDLTLVESLLQTVEKLESHEEDAEQLRLLFRIDHLATRMRRNSENLLALAGYDDAGRDFEPVPLLDVVRAAISEIAEYGRAQIASLPDVQVAGRPADDVSHILAELLDNATSKSPQSAAVVVRADRTGDGTLVLTVADSGIGMPADQLADINARLGRPPVLEAAASRRMGLYVVGRLAQRHGLRVQLRERPYGGIAAHLILPCDLVHGRPEPIAPGASNGGTDDEPAGEAGLAAGHEAASAGGSPRPGPETSVPAGAEADEA